MLPFPGSCLCALHTGLRSHLPVRPLCTVCTTLYRQDPEAFVSDMRLMFDALDAVTIRENTADVFKDMIETLRLHKVTLQNTVSTGAL